MTNPLNILELKYIIVNFLDLKSIGSMIQIDWTTYQLVSGMPIYKELKICLDYIKKCDQCEEKKYKLIEKIFEYACLSGGLNIIRNIFRYENTTNILNSGLVATSKNGYLQVIKYLIEKGANIHAGDDYALKWACENGHMNVAKFLVENGANIHVGNNHGLVRACKYGHMNIVKILVEKGVNIHANNDCSLIWACRNGHLDVAKFFSRKGANIHVGNEETKRRQ